MGRKESNQTKSSCHTPLAGLPDPDPYLIDHPWDIRDRRVLSHYPNLNTSWLYNGNTFHRVQMYTKALLSTHKRAIEYINKGGSHSRQVFFQQFWEKAPGQNWEKMIDLTAKLGEINPMFTLCPRRPRQSRFRPPWTKRGDRNTT